MKATVRAGRAMGSPLRLTLPGACEREADAAWAIAWRSVAATEADLTRVRPDSALSALNRAAGHVVSATPRLRAALAAAWRAFRVTRGRFDPRIIGALEAAGEHAGVELPASPDRLDPGDRWLALDARRGLACVSAPVDLGGIGKGLALRWAAGSLERAGFGDFLLHAGGDVVARGLGPAHRPWIVAIEDPTGRGPASALVELGDGALATSSVSVRRWTAADGSVRHHLIDPATLAPARTTWLAATILHADPAWADVLSTTALLAGSDVEPVAGRHPAWWIGSDGALRRSALAHDIGDVPPARV